MKKETIEEAAENYLLVESNYKGYCQKFEDVIKIFTTGANWQKEQTEELQKAQIIHTSYLESQLLKMSEKIKETYTDEEILNFTKSLSDKYYLLKSLADKY